MRTFINGATYYGSAFDQHVSYKVINYTPKVDIVGGAMLIEVDDERFYVSGVQSDMQFVALNNDQYSTHETLVLSTDKHSKPVWRSDPLLHITGTTDLHSVTVLFLANREQVAAERRWIHDYLANVANEDPDRTVTQVIADLGENDYVQA